MYSDFVWSFSKVAAYRRCPRSFRLQYIDRVAQESNAFSEYGTLCHALLEDFAKGNLLSFELADAYASRFNDVVKHCFPSFPPGIGLSYYKAGLKYFTKFEGFGDEVRIVAAEEQFRVSFGGIRFAGIIDLLLQSKAAGELTLVCHKSKSPKGIKKDHDFMVKQLYLYAMGVEERHGKLPSLLRLNAFRGG